jgi:hypothetical protein
MIEIADGVVDENNPIPEDVARSKLKIDTRRFLITVNNRPRFDKGSCTQVLPFSIIVGIKPSYDATCHNIITSYET